MTKTNKNSMLKRGENAARSCTLVALLLGILKGLVGIVSGSVALLADAIHSISDISASLAVFMGLRLAQKKPTERFPYGYYKAESFASFIVSIIIILSGIEVMRESYDRILTPAKILLPTAAILVASVSATLSYILAVYKGKVGNEISSQALISEGKHSRIDICVSLAVLLGVLFSYFGFPWVEALAGLLIGIAVIGMGLLLGKNAVLVLMDVCLKPSIVDQIRRLAEEVQGVKGVHEVKFRRSGPFLFGEMHIELDKSLPVEKAHVVSQVVEQKVKEVVREVDSLTVHIEPAGKGRVRVAIPVLNRDGWHSKPVRHFGRAPYFMLVDIYEGKIMDSAIVENPSAELGKKIGITAANFLIKQKVDTLLTWELGEGPFHALRDNLIQLCRLPEVSSVKEAVDAFINQELKTIIEPTRENVA